tara:strand:- start:110 stop:310 length:201 start_codon:yes stop_codon:yes gene_type:complete
VKFKAGQLATVARPDYNNAACIVLEHVGDLATVVWYKVYMIDQQRTTYFREHILSTINPQESESEV